ncbi:MAG TPA: hypothetical protein VGQ93_06390 [Lysobacter sp.]|nr:hypothetical protein [Lysobacter sp.]
MIFTHLARLVAVLAFVLGAFRVLLGLAIATGYIGPYEAALARYTTASSSGEIIDKGLIVILLAIALGTLAEISFSVRKGSN